MANLEWNEIKKTAEEIFDVWVGNPELNWAHEAWEILSKQGLAKYDNEVEKQIVIVRLFVLGTLYYEFCHFAFDEYNDGIDYSYWISDLSDGLFLSSFRLGQLVGLNYRNDEKIIQTSDDEKFIIETVGTLVEQQREIVTYTLVKGFGNESLLFASLWLSPKSGETDGDDASTEVLNYPTPEKMRAFEWIESGMQSLQEYQAPAHLMSKCEKIKKLISSDELFDVEFKIGLCYDPYTKSKNMNMTSNIVETVAAFINSNGGKLLIGIEDKTRRIVGINSEYPFTNPQKKNSDGFRLFLSDILRNRIDYGLIPSIYRVEICEIENKDVCEITVFKSPLATEFAFVGGKTFVRQDNRTVELTTKEFSAHMRSRKINAG
jgi:hypothetical protein